MPSRQRVEEGPPQGDYIYYIIPKKKNNKKHQEEKWHENIIMYPWLSSHTVKWPVCIRDHNEYKLHGAVVV